MPLLPRPIRRSISLATAALATAAVVQQLRRQPADRTWFGAVLGVPYDFRVPTPSRVRERWWNPNDKRLFTPQPFGLGWVVNLHRLTHAKSA